jgi:GNAT superfamily N-acetyltransferase
LTFETTLTDPRTPEAAELLDAMTDELGERYAGIDDGAFGFRPEDIVGPRCAFLILRENGLAVACGGFHPLSEDVAEVKRMFVRPEFRGRGYSRAVLAELERLAPQYSYTTFRLETGDRQPEAIGLYDSAGYRPIDPYGPVNEAAPSLCYEKKLP